MLEQIARQARQAVNELMDTAHLEKGDVLVVGCSSSEMVGLKIGTHSSLEAAQALVDALLPELQKRGVELAAQCCEHLNRALIVERAVAREHGWEPVNVVPQPKAGGSFATTVWQRMADPVAVEAIRAQAGMDIGGTLIGMHLKQVAVPVRLSMDHIGEAILLCARTRPKFIGGCRAVYDDRQL